MNRVSLTGVVLAISTALLGCEGQILGPRGEGTPEVPVEPLPTQSTGWPGRFAPTSDISGLRRLTTEQYLASVRSILGVDPVGIPSTEPVSPIGGFASIGASSAVISAVGVGKFEDASRALAAAAFSNTSLRSSLTPCTPSGNTDTACFQNFARTFGLKAFRRPLDVEEVDRYATLASTLATNSNDVWAGLEGTASAFLQSPNFLYMVEVGEADPAAPERNRLTSYEMATRLAYFLTNDTPDATLLAAAEADQLITEEGIRLQAERLLATNGARKAVRSYFSNLLALEGLDTLSRSPTVFPAFTPTIGAALKEETLLGMEDLVFTRDGDYRSVFDQQDSFLNQELATFYGVTWPSGATGFQKLSTVAGQRPGLLGQGGVLAVHDGVNSTSPTKRGLFVLTRLLCMNLPLSPPGDLVIPNPPSGRMTARQRLEIHDQNATCAGCHKSMDSVGLSLEHFDALGTWRLDDRGMELDTSGVIEGRAYEGEPGLSKMLREHPAVCACLMQSLYGNGVGRLATEFDQPTYAAMVDAFETSGGKLKPMLLRIATSDGFRTIPPPVNP
ncbi:MAG: DUF1592 domain-containing protein [Archangium sp.]